MQDLTMDDNGPRAKREGEDHNSPGLELMWLYGNLPRLTDYDRQAAKAPGDSLTMSHRLCDSMQSTSLSFCVCLLRVLNLLRGTSID